MNQRAGARDQIYLYAGFAEERLERVREVEIADAFERAADHQI